MKRALVILTAMLAIPAAAQGGFMGTELVTVEISSDIGSGKLIWLIPPGLERADQITWGLPAKAAVRSQAGHLIGAVEYMNVDLRGDPEVALNFAVVAGNAPTSFTWETAPVAFAPMTNPLACASAAVTLTDHGIDGAWASGELNGKFYQATYNTSSLFAQLIDPVTALPGSSNIGADRHPTYPPNLWETIPGPVSSIQSQFQFIVSANDAASGTSYFQVVIPEPATLALLAVGGLALVRRRSCHPE